MTPLWTGSHLIVSGIRQGTHAYALQRTNSQWQVIPGVEEQGRGDVHELTSVWRRLDYGHSKKQRGQFVALDAKTGATRWTSEGRDGDHASVLLTPRHLVYLTSGGDLIIARRATGTFEVERRYKVADADTWDMPVLLGSDVLVRYATGVIRLTPGR